MTTPLVKETSHARRVKGCCSEHTGRGPGRPDVHNGVNAWRVEQKGIGGHAAASSPGSRRFPPAQRVPFPEADCAPVFQRLAWGGLEPTAAGPEVQGPERPPRGEARPGRRCVQP